MEEEPGYSPEEIERGEDQPWHMWPWGCLAFAALAALIIFGLYRAAISMGFAGQVSL